MNAAAVAAALGARAEEVCRRYLPRGRKRGRYWTAGDIRGAKGRSLFVRLAPPGMPGKWTDAATGQHGVYGRAVRFGKPHTGTLLVGEGIETVLSIVTAIPDTVAAAALSAGSLGAFAPPPGIARLVIARDNDAEGERAADRLARRCARAGVASLVIVPEGNDFNDDLVALGAAALRARFAPLFRLAGGRGRHESA